MSLMMTHEYGTVSKEVLDKFVNTTFKFFVNEIKIVAHESKLGRRDLLLCLEINPTNPIILRDLLGLEIPGDRRYRPHISVLEKPL